MNPEDYVDSDDMEMIISATRPKQPQAGPSNKGKSSAALRASMEQQRGQLEAEIQGYEDEIQQLEALKKKREKDLLKLTQEISVFNDHPTVARVNNGKGKQKAEGGIDYSDENAFDWKDTLKETMQRVFNIVEFRLCQAAVCNANMDGRDIVVIMPTGGGKSLTYQLPALCQPGLTLVVSPLLSLITDQILHLQDAGVNAVMVTGATPKAERNEISSRLKIMAEGSDDIKLIYVTPEKLAKDNHFISLMTGLVMSDMLARIVIDEAHCVSQLGHDFRPDYKKLSKLRTLFPSVPIMALSATCPPKVLKDLCGTLKLKDTVDGNKADTVHTVCFTAPLYRKNLHYKVVPKPASWALQLKGMAEWIMEHHPDASGIVYAFTKKDTETIAKGLRDASNGKIRTGVYHAGIGDSEKDRLHRQWRKGDVRVVVATIAFGMGIDKSDVRFVLHHSLSKSMDGFYQESGRAGRDGKDADCVLFYRPQDTVHLSPMMASEHHGQEQLYDMVRFAQNMSECRKLLFAKYFSDSSNQDMDSWSTEELGAEEACGHCDNCTRTDSESETKDCTEQAWKLLRVADYVDKESGRVSLGGLVDLARGLGGGTFEVPGGRGRKGKNKETKEIDLAAVAGGKITLSKEETELLAIQLILSEHLQQHYVQNAYANNAYVKPGISCLQLSRFRKFADVKNIPEIPCTFRTKTRAKSSRASKGGATTSAKKRKRDLSPSDQGVRDDEQEAEGEDIEEADLFDDDDEPITIPPRWTASTSEKKKKKAPFVVDDSGDESESVGDGWEFSLRKSGPSQRPAPAKPQAKKPRPSTRAKHIIPPAEDVIDIDSD